MVDFKEGAKASGGSALSALAYAGAAILGVITANYAETYLVQPWYNVIAGLVVFAVPVFALRQNMGMMGPVRMYLAVAGLCLIVNGIIGLLSVSLPAPVAAVV